MTISTTKNRINQAADGIAVAFIYDFIVTDASHMNVYLDNVLQVTGYTVNGVGDVSGGDVTFDVAPADLVTVTLQRIVPETQLVDYLPYDPFPAETHEGALDKLTLIAQQLTDEIDRAIKADVTTPAGVSYTLPVPDAGSFLQWNVGEDGFVNVHISDLGDFVATTPFTETLLDDADADEFWATLMATLEKNTARTLLDVYSKAEADAAHDADSNIPARHTVLTKDALSQAGSSTPGFSAVLATADDGIDGTNYLRWQKDKNNIEAWYMSDSVRGDFYLSSNSTAAEVATVPALNADDVSFQWSLISTITGLTNRNKSYTAHYNPYLGVSVVGYEGDGVDGHEIPHHLGVVPELTMFKSRDNAGSQWRVQSPFFDFKDTLYLNSTTALISDAEMGTIFSDTTISLDTEIDYNDSTKNIIMYNFASKSGVCKIGKYIGTGAAGNYVECGFKPAFVMVKTLSGTGDWTIIDGMRGDNAIHANTTAADVAFDHMDFTETGFVTKTVGGNSNTLNYEYLFIAFAESSIDANKAVTNYTLSTNADQIEVANPALITFANGFNADGQVDVQEEIAGATLTYGATHEDKKYYLYRDQGSAWGQSEVRPLVGLTRPDADKYGEVSPTDALALDVNSRTTDKHLDYESSSGVALASGEESSVVPAWEAFADSALAELFKWQILTTTTSWLQYKHTEKRILKSWRMRADNTAAQARLPRRFTIEGSNDGLNWTAIDSAYTASDYVGNGVSLWGALQDTSANTTAYLYHRINITANNGDASYTTISTLEFNTIIEADYYLVDEAKMFNDAGTRIDRVYIGELLTDSAGDVISFINYAAAKQKLNELEVHGDLTVLGDIENWGVATAKCFCNGQVNPPNILSSNNIGDIVDLGTGYYQVLFKDEMDSAGYTVSIMRHTASSGYYNRSENIIESSKTTRGFKFYSASTSAVEDSQFDVLVFGGKKIGVDE